jgi:hypothetical protein
MSHRCPTGSGRRGRFPHSGNLLHRRHIAFTQLGGGFGTRARSSAGSHWTSSHPREAEGRIRAGEDQRPGSLRSCRRENNGRKSAVIYTENNGASEADGVHDSLDLSRFIIYRANMRDRVRQPDPALSNTTTRQNVASSSKKALISGIVQPTSMWLTNGPEDQIDRPIAEHPIRQTQIGARCVGAVEPHPSARSHEHLTQTSDEAYTERPSLRP